MYIQNGTYDSWRLRTNEKQGKEIPSGLEGKVEKLKAKLNVN